MKKKRYLMFAPVLLWLCLAVLLVRLESGVGSIQTMGDAVWYSLVTLTTVGYGDLYPVTAAGKVIGGIFVLMSTGFVTFLVCVVIASVTGQLLPSLRLCLRRGRCWYLFTDCSEGSRALMADLLGKDGRAVVVLTVPCEEELPEGVICLQRTVSELIALKGNSDCCVFCLTDDPHANYRKARSLADCGGEVYCYATYAPDCADEHLHLFDVDDNCARQYWNRNPLDRNEQTVVLIGFGSRAQRILERGLLVNVREVERPVHYHVFGDSYGFQCSRPALHEAVCVNGIETGKDSIFFHDTPWNSNAALLEQADRVIVCESDDGKTIAVLQELRRLFPVGGRVHVQLSYTLEEEATFGSGRELFTEELVMRRKLNRIAVGLHEIYCAGVSGAAAWSELSEFKRQSNISAADHLLTKIRVLLQDDSIREVTADTAARAYAAFRQTEDKTPLRRLEHNRWMRFHFLHNWRYGAVRNDALRMHPLLMPFEALCAEEQEKDDYPWELLEKLTEIL